MPRNILGLFKVVVRELPNNNVIQIHEVYWMHVGNKVNEVIDEFAGDREITITISKLR